MKTLIRNKNFWVMLVGDIALLGISYVLAYGLRFEFHIPQNYIALLKKSIIPVVISKLLFFYWFKLYRGMWRYTSIADLLNIIKAVFTSTMVVIVAILMFQRFEGYPRSVFVIDAILTLIFISGFRLVVRLFFAANGNPLTFVRKNGRHKGRKLLII
ncbi:MAG: polysaccharide biosynthesis protein, partial [Deltaproteobacteria bacterium]|nr:polysaccharide biosynthesis protein [Deltaproteobacteria bacterium]